MAEFIECGSVSISYDAQGIATVSFVVVNTSSSDLFGDYNSFSFGGVSFTGAVMSMQSSPIAGSNGWNQWQIQWQGVGN